MIKYPRPGFPTRDLIIAPGERISDIIAESHGTLLGGHDGTDKTVQRILTTYWFPSIYSETDFFIQNCPTCQKLKKKSKVPNTFLKPLKQADQVFERIHLDLFGPMKVENGKAYILVIVDAFSKFAIFSVIANKDAETVAKAFFDNWISIFGSPLSIVTDRGTDFNTDTMQKICDYLQIDRKVIATKHPESNAQAEVLNKKLSKYLTAMKTEGDLDWPKLVNSCQYAYNLSVHKALKNSPYHVLFGLDANTPLNNKGFVTQAIYGDKYQHTLGNRLKLARKLAKENNMEFRDDYVKRFNKNVKPHEFIEGMLVYLHRPELVKVNPKLASPWFGPFVILTMIGKANALIQELSNKKTKFVNVNRLRRFNNSISEWNKFKLTLDKEKKKKKADIQNPDEKSNDLADATAPKYAEFEVGDDVIILNPETEPKPMLDIKTEPPEIPDSVHSEPPEITDSISLEPTAPDDSSMEDSFRSVSDMPGAITSTPRKKSKESFLKTAAKLAFPKRYNTRAERMKTGIPVEEIEESEAKLEKTKKRKTKKKK